VQIDAADLYPPGGGRPRHQLLDVRAPIEVERGALPWSVNLPILEDHERHQVGICYKEAGQDAAIALGYRLTERQMPDRIAAWQAACAERSTAVFCWRGGLRSRLTQEFVGRDDVPRVAGGYKALRRHLQAALPGAVERKSPLVVAGLTGSGKTELLVALSGLEGVQALDLEAAAEHRGSAFGGLAVPQPAQATFENRLAAELELSAAPWLLLEDEGARIGAREVPGALMGAIRTAPVLMVEVPQGERLARLHREYVVAPAAAHGVEVARAGLDAVLQRLKGRLGGARVSRAQAALTDAAAQGAWFDPAAHEGWLGEVLERYYDPAYVRALRKLARPVAARGDHEELIAWMQEARTDRSNPLP
jgi:tRNA 2-selenouridine synthase